MTELPAATLLEKIATARRLGLTNVGRALVHRRKLSNGWYETRSPIREFREMAVLQGLQPLHASITPASLESLVSEAEDILKGKVRLFGYHWVETGSPPDWHRNYFSTSPSLDPRRHWSQIPDLDASKGDIKAVWELSRFDWLLVFARAFAATHDSRFLAAANGWLADWQRQNPPNAGPNWRCGQETSLRALTALTALHLTGDWMSPTSAWIEFFERHLERVHLTTDYARTQQNNHAISEAVALFVVGSWLAVQRPRNVHAKAWADQGREMLEMDTRHLFLSDGTFSQYSVNYHRLALDLLAHTEIWRRRLTLAPFSDEFLAAARAATRWMDAMVDPATGGSPNLGANDGALVLRLSQADYRDFRPALGLAVAVFCGRRLPLAGSEQETLAWLGQEHLSEAVSPEEAPARSFPLGGFVVLGPNENNLRAVIRAPRHRFRPSHADPLHVDLWWNGHNVLRDGGSYSYAAGPTDYEYFRGIQSHNTIEIDGMEPMPVISKFLFGSWIDIPSFSSVATSGDATSWSGEYRARGQATHRREVTLAGSRLIVRDRLSGVQEGAIARWRLTPNWNWEQTANGCVAQHALIEVAGREVEEAVLRLGWESLYYFEKTPLPVLEIKLRRATPHVTLTTSFTFMNGV